MKDNEILKAYYERREARKKIAAYHKRRQARLDGWITLHGGSSERGEEERGGGVRVFIDANGNVTKGPKELIGQNYSGAESKPLDQLQKEKKQKKFPGKKQEVGFGTNENVQAEGTESNPVNEDPVYEPDVFEGYEDEPQNEEEEVTEEEWNELLGTSDDPNQSHIHTAVGDINDLQEIVNVDDHDDIVKALDELPGGFAFADKYFNYTKQDDGSWEVLFPDGSSFDQSIMGSDKVASWIEAEELKEVDSQGQEQTVGEIEAETGNESLNSEYQDKFFKLSMALHNAEDDADVTDALEEMPDGFSFICGSELFKKNQDGTWDVFDAEHPDVQWGASHWSDEIEGKIYGEEIEEYHGNGNVVEAEFDFGELKSKIGAGNTDKTIALLDAAPTDTAFKDSLGYIYTKSDDGTWSMKNPYDKGTTNGYTSKQIESFCSFDTIHDVDEQPKANTAQYTEFEDLKSKALNGGLGEIKDALEKMSIGSTFQGSDGWSYTKEQDDGWHTKSPTGSDYGIIKGGQAAELLQGSSLSDYSPGSAEETQEPKTKKKAKSGKIGKPFAKKINKILTDVGKNAKEKTANIEEALKSVPEGTKIYDKWNSQTLEYMNGDWIDADTGEVMDIHDTSENIVFFPKDVELNGETVDEIKAKGEITSTSSKKHGLKKASQKADFNNPATYSQERKDNAVWHNESNEKVKLENTDKDLRSVCSEVWLDSSEGEKYAGWDYTAGSGHFNRFLRNGSTVHKQDQDSYTQDQTQKLVDDLSNMISKSSYEKDIWLQRGVKYGGSAAFLGIDEDMLYGSEEDLQKALVGKTCHDDAFLSCGSAKGTGFSGVIYNVFCPAGTEMMYVEPFSQYGGGNVGNNNHTSWDGKSKAKSYNTELETILQKGGDYRITKVTKKYGQVYIDMEVVGQNHLTSKPGDLPEYL